MSFTATSPELDGPNVMQLVTRSPSVPATRSRTSPYRRGRGGGCPSAILHLTADGTGHPPPLPLRYGDVRDRVAGTDGERVTSCLKLGPSNSGDVAVKDMWYGAASSFCPSWWRKPTRRTRIRRPPLLSPFQRRRRRRGGPSARGRPEERRRAPTTTRNRKWREMNGEKRRKRDVVAPVFF
uniref:Uncharacterized protein n=1 Tax=Oryza meridionalis TaxID=40149 RepID=A0A0E0ESF8_9ORYZ